jgi:hypothetical protein
MTSSADGQVLGTPLSFPFAGTAVAVEFGGLLPDGLDVDVAVAAASGAVVVVDPLEQAVADTATSTTPAQLMRMGIRMASPRFRRGSVAGHWGKAIRRP